MFRKKIMKAIYEGVMNALVDLDDDITVNKVQTSSMTKDLILSLIHTGDRLYKTKRGKYYVEPNKGVHTRNDTLMGYCCCDAEHSPTGKPLFLFYTLFKAIGLDLPTNYAIDLRNVLLEYEYNHMNLINIDGYINTQEMINNYEMPNVGKFCQKESEYFGCDLYVPSIEEMKASYSFMKSALGKLVINITHTYISSTIKNNLLYAYDFDNNELLTYSLFRYHSIIQPLFLKFIHFNDLSIILTKL